MSAAAHEGAGSRVAAGGKRRRRGRGGLWHAPGSALASSAARREGCEEKGAISGGRAREPGEGGAASLSRFAPRRKKERGRKCRLERGAAAHRAGGGGLGWPAPRSPARLRSAPGAAGDPRPPRGRGSHQAASLGREGGGGDATRGRTKELKRKQRAQTVEIKKKRKKKRKNKN